MDLLIKEANWANNSLEGNNSLVYEFQTLGPNRRLPIEFDGLHLVAFHPQEGNDL